MKDIPEAKKLISIIDSFEDKMLMANGISLFSSNNDEFVVISVNEDAFFELIGAKDSRRGATKLLDCNSFIHLEDRYLCTYTFLSQLKEDHASFNIRLQKEDASVVVAWIELDKLYSNNDNKTIAYEAKVFSSKSLLTKDILYEASINNYSSVLSSSNDFVYFKNLNHAFTGSSKTMANITGFSSGDEHIGLTDYDIFPKEHADIYYRLEEAILQGEKTEIEQIEPFYDENGKEGWVDTRKYPIHDKNGSIIGLFGISRDITQEILTKRKLEEAQEQLKQLANQDGLTLLSTRRHGYELCNQAVTQATRYKSPLSLIMFDVDHFKAVNDEHGHDCGDQVLVYISEIVREAIRDSDIVFRYGGEEFVICTPNTTLENTVILMERINKKLNTSSAPFIGSSVTVSSGITQLVKDDSLDKLIHRADKLLYKAKVAGRNCIRY